MQHSTCLILRIVDLEQPSDNLYSAVWQLYDQQGESIASASTAQALDEIAAHIPPAAKKIHPRVIVLLPGQSVLVAAAPMGNHARDFRKVHKAAAYAVEDQLAESAEEVHSAVGNALADPDSSVCVAIIRDAWIRKLIQELNAAGLPPDVVTSEALLLPCTNGKAFLLVEDGRVLFRFADTIASTLEYDVFLAFLANYLEQEKSPGSPALPAFSTLELWTAGKLKAAPASLTEPLLALCRPHGVTVTPEHAEPDSFNWLCQRWITGAYGTEPVNLLQGPYQPLKSMDAFPDLKGITVILTIWFVLQVGFNLGSTYYFNDQADQFHAQSVGIYRRLFPADARIVDLKAQFTQHLTADNSGGDNFMTLVSILASGMADAHHPELLTLLYDAEKGELAADMIASDFTSLDSFKHLDADVEIGSAAKEEKGIHGQVRIHAKGGKEPHG